MKDRTLESIVSRKDTRPTSFETLMPRRVRNILVVSSLYDSFTFEEDGRLSEMLFSEYLELNLRYAPNIERVSTAEEALEKIKTNFFDLVITMLSIGEMDIQEFGRTAKQLSPGLPIVLLAYNTREILVIESQGPLDGIDQAFVWQGDGRLFLAIIKYVEDKLNVWHDVFSAGVQCIIVVEDNTRFYSAYLPLLYTELVRQTQALMADGLNRKDKLMRMRARPKILLATSYEEGMGYYETYKDFVAGVIVDAAFPRYGKHDQSAGIAFARFVKETTPDRPVLVQSSVLENKARAAAYGARFIHKHSPTLLDDLRKFMLGHLGFGDFVFRNPDGTEVARAHDLRSLEEKLAAIPGESLMHHAGRNDFSTWLMARTEFDVAAKLRPVSVSEFANAEGLRRYLLTALEEHRSRSREGVVADFSSATFEAESGFVRIGSGSLGGKGRGLAFVNALLKEFDLEAQVDEVKISVPPTIVLSTVIFDDFMEAPGLKDFVLSEPTDDEIAQRFLDTPLTDEAIDSLRTFLSRARYPLAVRSSSLLEDASYQPFAGVYRTYMLPNNHPDLEQRLTQLVDAVRLVYASTFYEDARSYIESTPNRLEEEKMAVVIQKVVGRQYGDAYYPNLAGVARSYDFYPMEDMSSDDGVASVVLGLGRMAVEGGRSVRFSPAQPRKLYQFFSPEETWKNAQREFMAIDLSNPLPDIRTGHEENAALVTLDLQAADKHGTLSPVGSVFSPENQVVYDGTSRPGIPLVTLSGVLKAGVMPLADTLGQLLTVGNACFSNPVEMEFAVNLRQGSDQPHDFSILQIRPCVIGSESQDISVDTLERDDLICVSEKALGFGYIGGVHDVVFVPMSTFERAKTTDIAHEIGIICGKLRANNKPFALVGPGRWGSADKWLGIPVSWKQIAGVRCIVETDMEDIRVTPSQGTHFFQNITSFGIAYFTVNFGGVAGFLDDEWLEQQEVVDSTRYVRRLHFDDPLEIIVNGRKGTGAIMKPGRSVTSRDS